MAAPIIIGGAIGGIIAWISRRRIVQYLSAAAIGATLSGEAGEAARGVGGAAKDTGEGLERAARGLAWLAGTIIFGYIAFKILEKKQKST